MRRSGLQPWPYQTASDHDNKNLALEGGSKESPQKSDILLAYARENTQLELAIVEFKKSGVSKQVIIRQNSKNARINVRVYNGLKHPIDSSFKIITIDCIGKSRYKIMEYFIYSSFI